MCRVLCVSRSGYYLWLKAKPSPRTLENRHIVSRIKASWEESGKVYGYRKIHEDLLEEMKKEKIRRRVYQTRNEARADIFDYIELFYNPTRRHGGSNKLSPIKFEMNYFSEKEKCLGK